MYTIKAAALRTGLTTHTIRVWERRYKIIQPVRTDTNRRLFSEQDVKVLSLLKKATTAGHSIGQLSRLPIEEIERLVRELNSAQSADSTSFSYDDQTPAYFVEAALSAAADFKDELLDDILTQASVNFGQPTLIDQVIVPFLNALGEKWFDGSVRIAHEHAASAVVRSFLGRLLSDIRTLEQGPVLLTATLAGLQHEFGAMLAAIAAAAQGWRSHHLGANLPVEEIVFSAQKMNAQAVALSLIYPPADEQVAEQLRLLRRLLPDGTAIIVSGRALDSYAEILTGINALVCRNMPELREHLLSLRTDFKKRL